MIMEMIFTDKDSDLSLIKGIRVIGIGLQKGQGCILRRHNSDRKMGFFEKSWNAGLYIRERYRDS